MVAESESAEAIWTLQQYCCGEGRNMFAVVFNLLFVT